MTNQLEEWPGGQTWVFQGTVAEDATGGTHVVTLTVTPADAQELELLYGSVTVGATATAQAVQVRVTDGTNILGYLITSVSATSSGAAISFPCNGAPALSNGIGAASNLIVSGTMQLVLQVTTTAVSVTQTFAVVCRIKNSSQLPTVALADAVGAPTPTTNTNKVF